MQIGGTEPSRYAVDQCRRRSGSGSSPLRPPDADTKSDAPKRIAASNHNQLGVIQVVVAGGRRIGAEGCL